MSVIEVSNPTSCLLILYKMVFTGIVILAMKICVNSFSADHAHCAEINLKVLHVIGKEFH